MKNLQVFRHELINFDADVVGQCIDADNSIAFVLTRDFILFKTKIHGNQQERETVDHDFDPVLCDIGRIESNDVKLFEFVVETGSILIALNTGYLIRIGVSSFSLPSKCLYKHEYKISSIELSPDQDLIALADEEDNIHVLSSVCDILYSNNALTQKDSLHKPVGVGWGSKETQFFGLDGRPSKEQQLKQQVELNEDELGTKDIIESSDTFQKFRQSQEKCTVIDWRGDGQYISTLTYFIDSHKHCLKVWNRNLELQYMSDHLVTVERGLLAWVPNGCYVCCAQRRDHGINEIAMFEKNGMVHQRLTLPTKLANLYIKDLIWSPNSKILAIIVYKFHTIYDETHYTPILMLYTMQNFHYYLKFSSNLKEDCDYFLRWDSINPDRLHLVSSRGQYSEYICSFETAHATQLSTVAVVDANKILITPTEICSVPPPMSAIVIESASLISRMVINPLRADNIFILTLDNQLIYTNPSFDATLTSSTSLNYHLEHHVAEKLYNKLVNHHVVNLNNAQDYENLTPLNEFSLVATRSTGENCDILLLKLPTSKSSIEVELNELTSIKGKQVLAISRDTIDEADGIAVILEDGSCHWIDLSSRQIGLLFEMQVSNTIQGCNMINLQTRRLAQTRIVVSLAQDLTLRLNSEVLLANSCASFRITEHYLVYTTTDNSIHFSLIERLLDKQAATVEPWTQQIEAGGTLVIVNERNSKVILQMPRGNLEILHPRLLVFSLLTELLDGGNYVEAVKMARRHRINMNFLCDYLFHLSHVSCKTDSVDIRQTLLSKFLLDVANHDASMLCLLLTELNDDDTISGRYKSLMKQLPRRQVDLQGLSERQDNGMAGYKLKYICQDWLKHEDHSIERLKPTLLCLLKLNQLPEALHLIQGLDATYRKEALKFLLYFVDIDRLFSEALGTYNTEITLMVAGESNKDPKEYLVLLNDLNRIKNTTLRSHHIDMHLKRYDKALEHLTSMYIEAADDNLREKILDLTVSKRLFKKALEHFNSFRVNDLIEPTWKKYADYLLEKRCYTEAGLAYSKALDNNPTEEHLKAAIRSYLLGDDCDKALACLTRFGADRKIFQESLKQIFRHLVERDRCQEACIILRDMPEEEIKDCSQDLIKRGHWHLVDFILRDKLRENLRVHMREHMLDYHVDQLSRWQEELRNAKEHFNRLKELLTKRDERSVSNAKQDNCFISDSLSTVGSELSSTLSESGKQQGPRSGASSIKTRNSTKTTQSQALKKRRINLKPGSTYEDIALVLELKKFLSKQKINQADAMKIQVALFDYFEYQEANLHSRDIRNLLEGSLKFSREVSEVLWPISEHNEQKYSLYKRFTNAFQSFENLDFEVFIRPELPAESFEARLASSVR